MNGAPHYAIAFDTNILQEGAGKDFSQSWLRKSLERCGDVIESMDACEYFRILIPDLVLKEISQHQLENHKNQIDMMRGIKLPAWEFEYDASGYSKWLDGIHSDLRKSAKIGMVPLEFISVSSEDGLDRIIERVLRKDPPFSNSRGETDKGFKDAVIWESILEYKKSHISEQVILVSKDKLMTCDRVKDEYRERFNEDLVVVSEGLSTLCEVLSRLIGDMRLGYEAPCIVGEEAALIRSVKMWVFSHMPEIATRLGISLEMSEETKPEQTNVVWVSDKSCDVSMILRIGKCDLCETEVVTLIFSAERNSEDGFWLLRSLSIDGKSEQRSEVLDAHGTVEVNYDSYA